MEMVLAKQKQAASLSIKRVCSNKTIKEESENTHTDMTPLREDMSPFDGNSLLKHASSKIDD